MSTNKDNYMDSFRKNIFMYLKEKDFTIRELSESADMPFSTLNNLLYKGCNDIKASTAVSLARALNVSVDELLGCCTMDDKMMESVKICRGLPNNSLALVRYFIRHQEMLYKKTDKSKHYISRFKPDIANGIMRTTNISDMICIDNFPQDAMSKVYTALRVPCDILEPYYLSDETILIAADRVALKGERCVITSHGGIYIVVKDYFIDNGKKKQRYISLFEDSDIIPDDKVDDKIGYVVGFLNSDGTWGIR